jgi:hypothetical protein
MRAVTRAAGRWPRQVPLLVILLREVFRTTISVRIQKTPAERDRTDVA